MTDDECDCTTCKEMRAAARIREQRDLLDECEKVLDLALSSNGHSTNQRIEAMLAKLRAQEKDR